MNRSQEVRIDITTAILKELGSRVGVPCSLRLIEELYDEVIQEWEQIDRSIKDLTGFTDTIDYTGRTARANHYAVIAGKFLFDDPYKFCKSKTSSGNLTTSLTKPDLEYYQTKTTGKRKELVSLLLKMASTNHLLNATRSHRMHVTSYAMTRTDSKDKDIVWIPTNYEMGKTGRITNDNISVQNMAPRLRETVKAPEGYKLISCDIKAQEVVICINAVFRDNELKKIYLEEGDCYRALLRRVGFEITKETRNLAKIPILGKIRGMSDNTVYRDMGEKNKELARAMLNYINNEPGMKAILEMARKEANSQAPRLRGLFKSTFPLILTDKEERQSEKAKVEMKMRKILSAVFQTTAAEMLCYSLGRIFLQQIEGNIPNGKDFMFLIPIHDEVIFMAREDLVEEAKAIIDKEFLVSVNGWVPFKGEFAVGEHYVSK